MGRMLVVASAFLCFVSAASSIEIDRADGGYEDIQVAISKDIPYNESVIENIKALFRYSSEFLHEATNGRVYFKKVIIEIPHTWPKRAGAQVVYESTFEKCDVRIDMPTPGHGDKPFTAGQDKSCGKSSGFIQLTPGFLGQNTQNVTAGTKRNLAYDFVHEWAHMRYGVFDEYGRLNDRMYPLMYCSGRKIRLNSCSGNLEFHLRTLNGRPCRINWKKCLFAEDCLLTVYSPAGTRVESSIMFMPYMRTTTQFCNGTSGIRSHNTDAPTAQNALCSQKSTWEVIAGNDDFRGLPEPNMSKRREVTFLEKQANNGLGQRVVLVLDVSSSMHDYDRMDFLKAAVTRYINDLKDGSVRLAIVTFSDDAKVLHPLMGVNASTRQGFLNAVAGLQVERSTCIGCGIQKALELLNTPSEKPEGAIVVVLTDGEENREPNISTMMPEVEKAKVTVNTVAVGPSADLRLVDLAVATEGRAYTFIDLEENLGVQLESVFLQSTTAQADEKLRPLMLLYETIKFKGKFEKAFPIDSGFGNETVVIIQPISRISAQLTPWLVDPSGNKCQECRKTADGVGYVISIPSPAKVGTWKLYLETNSPDQISVTIQVRSTGSDVSPIQVSCEVTCKKCSPTEIPIISARVTKGKLVVLNAAVQAEVIGPMGGGETRKSTFLLFDDGQDPDNFADDGTYSNYFVDYKGPGRYSIKAHVSDQNETGIAVPSGGSRSFSSGMADASEVPIPGGAKEFSMDDFITDNTLTEDSVKTRDPVESFQRVEEGGSFEIIGDRSTEDLPPGNIRDLRVADLQPGSNGMLLVQLTWTWPGAHLTYGNVSNVTIRASEDFASLKSNFDNQTEITSSSVVDGNLDPLPSRAKHVVTIALPPTFASLRSDGEYDWTAYIAIRVANSYGRSSDTSNVVNVSYKPRRVTTGVAATTKTAAPTSVRVRTTKEATADKKEGESSEGVLSSGAWVVIIVAVVVVIGAIVIAIIVIAIMKTTNTDTLETPGEQQTFKSMEETVKKKSP